MNGCGQSQTGSGSSKVPLRCEAQSGLSVRLSSLTSMAAGRPDLPRHLRRDLLVEAGHRCAIPTCRATPVELAHIVPWSRTRKHDFANMIALCPNCHTRFDNGEIDRTAMFLYKAALDWNVRRLRLLDAYRRFQTAIEAWSCSIGALELANVANDETAPFEVLVTECCAWAGLAEATAAALGEVASEETAQQADWLGAVKRWADDVVDGLLPSTFSGADRHDAALDGLGALHTAVCAELGVAEGQLLLQPTYQSAAPAVSLGGSGNRY